MKQSSLIVGHYLALVREQAGIKQAELARKVTWSSAVLSRVENGERELSHDELNQVLAAIGTDEALLLCERLDRDWNSLPIPEFDHPDQEALWAAEKAAIQLEALSQNEEITASFKRRVDEYLTALKHSADLVQRRDHTVAFIGSIGIGKSTAICRMAGLEVIQEKETAQPVLEAGAGGITICEVHIYTGHGYGITIEPSSDEEIRQHVSDFADHIIKSTTDSESNSQESESQGISKEIERAIRNMANLKVRKEKIEGKTIRKDEAKLLAQVYPHHRELIVQILSKMNLHKRDCRNLWYDNSKGKPPMVWLKDTFEAINNGRHPDFSLPKRMEVIFTNPVLKGLDLTVKIVDTKGIDRTAARPDLESHLNDSHTLAVLCSGFNNAPGAESRLLLERASESGVRNLSLKTALLVLPRPEESLAVKDDDGQKVDSVEEGYELKADQIMTALEHMSLNEIPIAFFNAREDNPAVLQDFVINQIGNSRENLKFGLETATNNALKVVSNQAEEQTQSVIKDVASQLMNWLKTNKSCPIVRQQIQTTLIKELQQAHSSTIHAAVRRGGDWPNLNYSHQLGHGAKVLAINTLQKMTKDFQAVTENLKTNPDFSVAVLLITQTESVMISAFDDLLKKMQLLGETLFEDELKKDTSFWNSCEVEWGKGSGYRDRVVATSSDWFDSEGRNEMTETIQSLLSTQWKETIERVEALLEI